MSIKTISPDIRNQDWRKEKRLISINALDAPDAGEIESVEQVLRSPYCSRTKEADESWEELVKRLLTPVMAPKPQGELAQMIDKVRHGWWSPSAFAPGRRLGKNCGQVSWAALDVDDDCPPLDMLERRMRGAELEGVIIPSYSATEGKPKVRIVIAIDEPVVGDDLADLKKRLQALQQSLAALLGVRIDSKVACDPARLFWASIDNGVNLFGRAVHVRGQPAPTELLIDLGQKRVSFQRTL